MSREGLLAGKADPNEQGSASRYAHATLFTACCPVPASQLWQLGMVPESLPEAGCVGKQILETDDVPDAQA